MSGRAREVSILLMNYMMLTFDARLEYVDGIVTATCSMSITRTFEVT